MELFERFRSALADRYQIEREAGRGGMATVYLARDLKHGRQVAVKVLHPEYVHAIGAERFLREIATAARLQHPHIVGVHDSGEAAGLLYYVMPYVEGETLRDRLNREKQLRIEEAVEIARQVAGALSYAHNHGVVHRDIKPENILLHGGNASVADFGIAKAIDSASEAKLTSSGLVAGTPLYMSPEQAAGERDIDGRSDIYNLACVLFELLAGVPPFHGATPRQIMTQHMTETPPRIRKLRETVSPALERVLVRAMAKVPADRYATAGEFEGALAAALAAPEEQGLKPRNRAKWAAATVALLAAGTAVWLFFFRQGETDPTLSDTVAVLPFEHTGGAHVELDGDNCQVMLHDALARWQGVKLVNTYQINDARSQRGNRRLTLEDRFALAEKLRARHAIWGHVRAATGGVIEVRAAIYDVRAREPAQEYTVRVKRSLIDASAMFSILADSLMARIIGGSGELARGAMETTNSEALRAYLAGHKALSAWDINGAVTQFRSASDLDPGYASAHLWYAQTMAWTSDRPESWRAAARRAVALRAKLAEQDGILSQGLLALGTGNYPAACELFSSLVARDSSNFAAWYGLGECRSRDKLVIPKGNPQRWYFRGSYHAAVLAYQEALERVPAAYLAFRQMAPGRLSQLLFAEPNRVRDGFALASDTVWFRASPTMQAETLAFFPVRASDFGSRAALQGPVGPAVTYTRRILGTIAEEWRRAFPRSAEAHAAVAQVLEASTQTEDALTAIRKARALAPDTRLSLQLGLSEVRLLLKLQRFEPARALADSMFAWPVPNEHEKDWTAGLAALTGRTARAAELLQSAAHGYAFSTHTGTTLYPPTPLSALTLTLAAYSAAGAPASRIQMLANQVDRSIPSYYPTRSQQSAARDALLSQSMSAAVPVLQKSALRYVSVQSGILEETQTKYLRGDFAGARAQLNVLFARRESLGLVPGNVSIDHTFQEAWLLLAMGDTAAAAEHLDRSLNALPTLGTFVVRRVQEGAGLVRAMALRAEIAEKRGEREAARRWAAAVAHLWSSADVELQPAVRRMREMISH
ncbi:MAG: protein kinase domain-containing protein [Gemmatimonadaceae bacterium]